MTRPYFPSKRGRTPDVCLLLEGMTMPRPGLGQEVAGCACTCVFRHIYPLILHRWYWRPILAIRYDPETDGGMESLLDASSWPLVLVLRHRD